MSFSGVVSEPATAVELRAEVRTFLDESLARGDFVPQCDAWLAGFSPEFSRELGRRGWIGMTWPEAYGGHERSAVERLAMTEELLAAGAPVAAHWIADRQSGPQIYRHAAESVRTELLPAIARGECFVSLGLSEPDSGSDLASVRTRARATATGWTLSGTKVWTSHAHHCHYLSVLCRTSEPEAGRHSGLSILLVKADTPGVTIRPIRLLTGEHHFNEVIFDSVDVPAEMLIGEEGAGWALVTAELALERSGAERFLSTYPLLQQLIRDVGEIDDDRSAGQIGTLVAELMALRRLSASVARAIDAGANPANEAALVKDLGTRFEKKVIEVARSLRPIEPSLHSADPFARLLAQAVLSAPGFTLRGGTNEILRGLVARSVGVS
jgi:alkylation response protein AidB-like acyl-CoA dehydrogenase